MTAPTGPHAPRVVLVGPPGAGKSTIGRKLARELGVPLYDTDAGIEEETGRTIPEIFAADGEPEFRRIEEQVVRRAVLDELGVVSLGGGAVLSASTRALLRERTVVYLEISVAEGLRRTGASTGRPLLNGADPGAKYRELMRIRRPLYREVASIRVRTDGRSPGRVVRAILAELGVETDAPDVAVPPTGPVPAPGSRSRARRRARARAAARRGQEQGARTDADRTAKAAGSTRNPQERAATERVSGDRVAAEGAARNPRRRRRKRRVTATGRRPDAAASGADTASGAGSTGNPAVAARAGDSAAAGQAAGGRGTGAGAGDAGGSGAGKHTTDPAAPGTPPTEGGGRARRAGARRTRGRNRLQTTRTDSEHT